MKKNYTLSNTLVTYFVTTLGLLFVVGSAATVWQIAMQYNNNPNLGGWFNYLFSLVAVPIMLFIIAYGMNPRKLTPLQKSFESLLFVTVGQALWSFILQALPLFFSQSQSFINYYMNYELVWTLGFVALYTIGLFWLRASKRWQ